MTDHTTLIAELRQHAEWARAELNQARAELFDRAADALERAAAPKCTHKYYQGFLEKNGTFHGRCYDCGKVWTS